MSKIVQEFFSKVRTNFDVATKFKGSHVSGVRILPSRTEKNDASYQLRIDAGELIANIRNIVLQVNVQASSTALRDWLKKNGTHAKLATASFDTTAVDLDAEAERAMNEMETKAKANL